MVRSCFQSLISLQAKITFIWVTSLEGGEKRLRASWEMTYWKIRDRYKTYWTLSLFLSQLEAFYSIFTTEQQDHVKSVEYLRNNFRPLQSLDNREVFKSAVKDAWLPDLTDSLGNPYGTDASKGGRALLTADWLTASIKPDVCTLWLWITYPVFISSRIVLDTNLDSNRFRFPSLVLTHNASHNARVNACVSVSVSACA